ncbi:MAG: hypothetical protein ACI80V_000703 [Rhodothermales bacterium]|jgi:hypothetical protein
MPSVLIRKPLILAALMAASAGAPGAAQSTDSTSVSACETGTANAYLEVGNVRAFISNNGTLFRPPPGQGDVGYEVPKGGGVQTMYVASLWVGGYIGEQLHMAGVHPGPLTYEFWPGPLDEAGQALPDCSRFDRIWSVGREDVEDYERTGRAWRDLADWPTGLGAPTLDAAGRVLNLSGLPLSQRVGRIIDLAAGERPLISGETMFWWIMNDAGGQHEFSGTPPIGLEVHMSAFAYQGVGALPNTTFYKLRMRKPAGPPLEDSFFGVSVDADLGNFTDDLIGSDTLLGLAYTYNSDNDDEGGAGTYGEAPPAVGLDFFRGPVSSGWLQPPPRHREEEPCGNLAGGEDFGMTSFGTFNTHSPSVAGTPTTAQDLYYYMTGRWKDGQRFTVGGNGRDGANDPTCFLYPGEPPGFWSEFSGSPVLTGDRTFFTSSGPFRVTRDEPQEVLFGIITSFGSDNLDSIRQLKEDDRFVQNLVDTGIIDGPAPTPKEPPLELADNGELAASFYPNPASDVVNLGLRLPEALEASVTISDLVGRHQATILSGLLEAGSYEKAVDVSGWPTGVYLARIKVGPRSYSRHIVVAR